MGFSTISHLPTLPHLGANGYKSGIGPLPSYGQQLSESRFTGRIQSETAKESSKANDSGLKAATAGRGF